MNASTFQMCLHLSLTSKSRKAAEEEDPSMVGISGFSEQDGDGLHFET